MGSLASGLLIPIFIMAQCFSVLTPLFPRKAKNNSQTKNAFGFITKGVWDAYVLPLHLP